MKGEGGVAEIAENEWLHWDSEMVKQENWELGRREMALRAFGQRVMKLKIHIQVILKDKAWKVLGVGAVLPHSGFYCTLQTQWGHVLLLFPWCPLPAVGMLLERCWTHLKLMSLSILELKAWPRVMPEGSCGIETKRLGMTVPCIQVSWASVPRNVLCPPWAWLRDVF